MVLDIDRKVGNAFIEAGRGAVLTHLPAILFELTVPGFYFIGCSLTYLP